MTDIPETERQGAARVRSRRRRARAMLLVIVGAVVSGLLVGFVDFANRIAGTTPPANPRAEGIVVLTGGTSRIDEALQLLAEGRASRLLISGVNPAVTRESIASTVSANLKPMLECCVDLDFVAKDTIGNAAETRNWAERQGFTSLIVVTSGYHMPRSMAELEKVMPDRQLIPFPVTNPELNLAHWWAERETLALLLREYSKFLLAEARRLLSPVPAANASPLVDR